MHCQGTAAAPTCELAQQNPPVYVHSSAAICSALRASGAQCRSPGDMMLCCGSVCLSTNAASAATADMPASVSTLLALQLLTSSRPCCVHTLQ